MSDKGGSIGRTGRGVPSANESQPFASGAVLEGGQRVQVHSPDPAGLLSTGEIVTVYMQVAGQTVVQRGDGSYAVVTDTSTLAAPPTAKITAGPRFQRGRYDVARQASVFSDIGSSVPRNREGFILPRDDGGDAVLEKIYAKQGFNQKSHAISEAEYQGYVQSGEVQIFRGVAAGPKGKRQYADEFIEGSEHFPGRGIYGNGTYTAAGAYGAATAHSYAQGTGTVLRMTLRKNARVTTYENLQKDYERHKASLPSGLHDIGAYAAARGFDAYYANANAYVVILNRGAVRVVKEP